MKLRYYTDPGHGWLAVKRKVLKDLGLLDKITSYSYQKGGTVYLEEDCDLPTLATKMAQIGNIIVYDKRHTDRLSPIRSYEGFRAA
jgi:hypothetical protein